MCPHGHTDPRWFADDEPFDDPTALLVTPDHYLTRMLYSQGVPLEALGRRAARRWRAASTGARAPGARSPTTSTCSAARRPGCGSTTSCTRSSASTVPPHRRDRRRDLRPHRRLPRRDPSSGRAPCSTGSASTCRHHRLAARAACATIAPLRRRLGRPSHPDVPTRHRRRSRRRRLRAEHRHARRADRARHDAVGRVSGALFERRATRSLARRHRDRPRPPDRTRPSTSRQAAAQALLNGALAGTLDDGGKELLRGQILVEMAAMSIEDGLVMQLHPGSRRNHNRPLFDRFGRDVGADIPGPIDYVDGLRPLLDRVRQRPSLPARRVHRSTRPTFSRELAPIAGHYPAMYLGPPWWFLDSVEGMLRFRRAGHRDGRLRQHHRLRRRHPRVPVDPGPPRRRPARRLPLPRRARQRPSPRTRRRPRDRPRPRRRPRPAASSTSTAERCRRAAWLMSTVGLVDAGGGPGVRPTRVTPSDRPHRARRVRSGPSARLHRRSARRDTTSSASSACRCATTTCQARSRPAGRSVHARPSIDGDARRAPHHRLGARRPPLPGAPAGGARRARRTGDLDRQCHGHREGLLLGSGVASARCRPSRRPPRHRRPCGAAQPCGPPRARRRRIGTPAAPAASPPSASTTCRPTAPRCARSRSTWHRSSTRPWSSGSRTTSLSRAAWSTASSPPPTTSCGPRSPRRSASTTAGRSGAEPFSQWVVERRLGRTAAAARISRRHLGRRRHAVGDAQAPRAQRPAHVRRSLRPVRRAGHRRPGRRRSRRTGVAHPCRRRHLRGAGAADGCRSTGVRDDDAPALRQRRARSPLRADRHGHEPEAAQRLLDTVRARRAAGLDAGAIAEVLALWAWSTRHPVHDPLAPTFAAIAARHGDDPAALVAALVALTPIFGDLAGDIQLGAAVTARLQALSGRR